MIMKATEVFIKNTAKDYDIGIDDVERIVSSSESYFECYEKLEAFIRKHNPNEVRE